MATTQLKSIKIVRETSFGSLSATTLEPDPSIFDNAVELNCDRASITSWGDAVLNERDEPRNTFGSIAPDPESIPAAAGGLFRLRRGDLNLTMTPDGLGTGDPDNDPLVWILDAGWVPAWQPTHAAENAGSNVAVQTFDVSDGADWQLGGVVSITRVGKKAEFSRIVEKDTDTLGHSPAFSAEADAGPSSVRPCRTWSSNPGTLGDSLAVELNFDSFRQRVYGIRPNALTIRGQNRRAQFEFGLSAAIVVDDHETVDDLNATNVGAPPWRSGGTVLHALGAEVVMSNVINTNDAAYPRIPGRTTPAIDSWEISFTNTLDAVGAGHSTSVLGMSEWEVVDRQATATLSIDGQRTGGDAFDGDLWSRGYRNLAIGLGPGGANGSGAAVIFPAAHLTADPGKRNSGNPRVQTDLAFSAGAVRVDEGTATASTGAAFLIAMVQGAEVA